MVSRSGTIAEEPVCDGRRRLQGTLDPGAAAREDFAKGWIGSDGSGCAAVLISSEFVPERQKRRDLARVGAPVLEGRACRQGRDVRTRMRSGQPAPERLQERCWGRCSPRLALARATIGPSCRL